MSYGAWMTCEGTRWLRRKRHWLISAARRDATTAARWRASGHGDHDGGSARRAADGPPGAVPVRGSAGRHGPAPGLAPGTRASSAAALEGGTGGTGARPARRRRAGGASCGGALLGDGGPGRGLRRPPSGPSRGTAYGRGRRPALARSPRVREPPEGPRRWCGADPADRSRPPGAAGAGAAGPGRSSAGSSGKSSKGSSPKSGARKRSRVKGREPVVVTGGAGSGAENRGVVSMGRLPLGAGASCGGRTAGRCGPAGRGGLRGRSAWCRGRGSAPAANRSRRAPRSPPRRR